MATVCITFFLITQFYVCKMEADLEDRLKKISRREKRWSMNSQRLEEIVAELMKPISDVRRNFDTDLSALLEEYLTEAGLRALEAGEDESSDAEPNFAEIALLLQHSANIYSRKVDFLYQDVLRVTDSLNNTIIEEGEEGGAEAGGGGAAAGGAALRAAGRRGAAGGGGFAPVPLERSAAGWRDAAPRPPPTLPRMYIELEPRQLADADAQLLDQAGEPIGLLADFHVAWRLQDGFLVEELEGVVGGTRGGGGGGGARALGELRPPGSPPPPPPLTLPQLSAPPPSPSPFLPPSPFNCSTPLPKPIKKERKRRIDVTLDIDDTAKLLICEADVLSELRRAELTEFSVPERWIRRVVQKRCGQVLSSRLLLRCRRRETEFLGWDTAGARDVGGFPGWAAAEARSGHSALTELRRVRLRADDSDDDGFFEQSSYSDGEPRHSPDRPPDRPPAAHTSSLAEEPEWYSWRERVLSRSAEATPDVQQTAALLLRALAAPAPAAPAPAPTHIDALLRRQHLAHGTHPAHLTLAALFLANSGNIEIVQGEPLTVNSFSIKLLSSDESLYRPAIARDHLS